MGEGGLSVVRRRRQRQQVIGHFFLGCSDHDGVEWFGDVLSIVSLYSDEQSLCGFLVPQCPVKSCQKWSD